MSGAGSSDDRHLPLPDAETEEFWQAASRRELIVRYCSECRLHYHYPRARCPRCLGEHTSWRPIDGSGVIYSYTVVHQAPSRAFRDRVPYVLALVDLDEGVRMMSGIEADSESVHIGQRVHVEWRAEGDVVLPVFAPSVGS